MGQITVTRPSQHALDELGVGSWETWTCDVSTFDWHYDQKETCYILEGSVTVTAGQEKVDVKSGDLAIFPAGLDCTWTVTSPIKKHFKFG